MTRAPAPGPAFAERRCLRVLGVGGVVTAAHGVARAVGGHLSNRVVERTRRDWEEFRVQVSPGELACDLPVP